MDKEYVIKLENICKTYLIRDKNIQTIREGVLNLFNPGSKRKLIALENINLEIKKGEVFGIIGNNGSGKSTLLQIINGVYPPDRKGKMEVKGKVLRLALGMGFNPEFSARQNIYINGSLMGLSFRKIGEKFNEIIQFAELEAYIDTKLKFFSSGMISRLAFSIAVNAEADIFLMDEFFGGVGDYRFQEKSARVFKSAFVDGKTIVLVSHLLENIKTYCDRAMLMHNGKAVVIGKPEEVIEEYLKIIK